MSTRSHQSPAATRTLGIARRKIASLPSGVTISGLCSALRRRESRNVHMVVMIVTEHHDVDRRQIFESDSGRRYAPRAGERNWAGPVRPYGVGEDVETARLDQHARVADNGGAQSGDAIVRNGLPHRDRLRPRSGYFPSASTARMHEIRDPFRRYPRCGSAGRRNGRSAPRNNMDFQFVAPRSRSFDRVGTSSTQAILSRIEQCRAPLVFGRQTPPPDETGPRARSAPRGAGLRPHHDLMERLAVTHDIRSRGDKLFEWRLDGEKNNIGDKTINARIDAGWLRAMYEFAPGMSPPARQNLRGRAHRPRPVRIGRRLGNNSAGN